MVEFSGDVPPIIDLLVDELNFRHGVDKKLKGNILQGPNNGWRILMCVTKLIEIRKIQLLPTSRLSTAICS